MKTIALVTIFCLLFLLVQNLYAQDHPGKALFYTIQSKYGTCNTCHTNGGSAGRWDFETMTIDPEEGRKIPSLKGIGERKEQDQIERSIKLMEKLFAFKLTDEQRSQLAEYVGTL